MTKRHNLLFLVLILISGLTVKAQKFDNLAKTPPMGWNSWNTFATNIDEKLVRETADEFIRLGLKDAGYKYLVLDDGWMAMERDAAGNLIADPKKFPSGMKNLADYIHGKGMQFGLYNCAGSKTCGGYPGSRGHEYQDALTYASYDCDFLKYDWCNTGKMVGSEAYTTMRDALYAAKRPVVFSICEWGDQKPWKWGGPIGHMWRTTGDIYNCFDCEHSNGTWSSWGVMKIVDMRDSIRQYAGPGHWNDPDMLEVGNGVMTVAEDRTHFALWSIMAAPLILGNDLRKITPEALAIITNKEVIAVDQDTLGVQGFRVKRIGNVDVWAKPLAGDNWAIAFVNRGKEAANLNLKWADLPITDDIFKKEFTPGKKTYQLRDLYAKKEVGTTRKDLKATLVSHDILMLRLSPKE